MKVSRVEALSIGQFLYARVETECGLVGIGESGAWGQTEASRAAIVKFGEYLVGKDPRRIEHHWNIFQRFGYFNGAAITGAVAAIDIALWDILGKSLNTPVYQLLGGPYRDRVRVYAHVYAPTVDEVVAGLREAKAAGFTAVGHLNPFLDEDEGAPWFSTHVRKIGEAAANVGRFRDAVGQDVDLLIELHRRLTPAEAIAFIRATQQYEPMWYEDPIRPENLASMAEIARATGAPIATGERFATIYDFQQLLEMRGAKYARVSVGVCGGITGARKVAAIAEANNIEIAPHNPISPVGLAACLQVAAAVPNCAIQEYPTGFDGHVMLTTRELLGSDIIEGIPEVTNGFLALTSGPGIGVTLRPDAAERRPERPRPVSMRRHFDGSLVDQ